MRPSRLPSHSIAALIHSTNNFTHDLKRANSVEQSKAVFQYDRTIEPSIVPTNLRSNRYPFGKAKIRLCQKKKTPANSNAPILKGRKRQTEANSSRTFIRFHCHDPLNYHDGSLYHKQTDAGPIWRPRRQFQSIRLAVHYAFLQAPLLRGAQTDDRYGYHR